MIRLLLGSDTVSLLKGGKPQAAYPPSEAPDTGLCWVDLEAPTWEELQAMGKDFAFHPLALEDAYKLHQRPKLDFYEDCQFLVFYSAAPIEPGPPTIEVNIFAGRSYLVTVHANPLPQIEEARQRWESHPAEVRGEGAGFLLYCLLDSLVDSYFAPTEERDEVIEALEERLLESPELPLLHRAQELRKDLLSLRRIVGRQLDVVASLMHRADTLWGPGLVVYLADVHDHLLRLHESLDVQWELLALLVESYLSSISNQLNQVMKVLTAAATILMGMALVAGIYGMNFAYMPELRWPFGYAFALGVMAALGLGLALFFRWRGWL